MEQEMILERYSLSMERILAIRGEETVKEPFGSYFKKVAEFILLCGTVFETAKDGGLKEWSEDQLRELNQALYADILPENYEKSYGNPAYAANALGEEMGKLLSFLYTEIRGDIVYAFEGRMLDMVIYNEAFIEIYNLFEEEGTPDVRTVHDVLYWCVSDYCDVTLTDRLRETLDPSLDFAKKIIMESDLSNTAYLYQFGEYISEDELVMADFLGRLPLAAVKEMADTYTEGYIRGFQVMGRDLSKKKTVMIRYPLGMERMIREAVKNFEAAGLSVIIPRGAINSINKNPAGRGGYGSSSPNKQYAYDHRFDSAVYMDKAFRDRKLAVLKTAYEQYKKEAAAYAGPAVVETFGESGFDPVNNPEAWAFTEKQQKLFLEYRNLSMPVSNEYIPGDETSFTIIAFPVPSIGDEFEEIFKETIKINTLDSNRYGKIQQSIIDTLDRAQYVEIVGSGENCTHMRVNLWELSDSEKQTKFENCVADVNIPVGEVFTSPKLSGTSGILNVSAIYIAGIQFRNLKIEFQEGRVTSVGCDNFLEELDASADGASVQSGKEAEDKNVTEDRKAAEDRKTVEERKAAAVEAGRKLVIQEIMRNHESVPLGEFAIGTNTTAYAMAEKFGILDRLPILIVEKMGPHFAVGDTCYSWSEDSPMYNPDGKEMIARDNEVSILRKEDVSKAYFGVHTDITIPYKEIGRITAVTGDGERYDIIADGRFVLPGTEELNEAFLSLAP